jgi:hypothetical protein
VSISAFNGAFENNLRLSAGIIVRFWDLAENWRTMA